MDKKSITLEGWVISNNYTTEFLTLLMFSKEGEPTQFARFDIGKRIFLDSVPIELSEKQIDEIINKLNRKYFFRK